MSKGESEGKTRPRGTKKGPAVRFPQDTSARREGASFPIVGVGASAGGLEALELFLSHVPEGSGMAFVVVQHLDPTHKGMMAELLQRSTAMKVSQAKDRAKVEPDCVYVIPPNRDLSLLHGRLHLLEPTAPRGLRLPIDFFFRSLADDRNERSIGVILSGMGSDGTAGLRAIKEKAGVVLVQDPSTARFDGMPRSAIDAGLADIVAPAEELPAKIMAYLRHAPLIAEPGTILDSTARSALEKAVLVLRGRTGHDFSLYKKTTLYRRIERRMGIHQIDRIAGYVRFLQENPAEVDLLFKELLIGVTRFFRDPEAWELLKVEALPSLVTRHPGGGTLRAWVPGCSTGEEAYSLAMVFQEVLDGVKGRAGGGGCRLQIFATDLDRDAIDRARQGVFPANIAADVPPERLSRFFVREADGYRVRKEIRETVIFAPQNLIMDPPFTKLDLLSCRNLLIYLEPELQKKLLPLFHYSLNPGGVLFLGSAESIGSFSDLFAPLGGKAKLYRRSEANLRAEPVAFPSSFAPIPAGAAEVPPSAKPPGNLEVLADKLLLQRYSPPAVLVSEEGDVLYISGHIGKFLEPAAGKANWNVFAMAREGLRHELPGALQKVRRERGALTLRGVKVKTEAGEHAVDVTVQAIDDPGALRGMLLVVFADAPSVPKGEGAGKEKGPGRPRKGPAASRQVAELEQELAQAREEAQILRDERQTMGEEMQSSQEELKSANEELQSTNEELQSTNEELTTSREEMQSMNEELQTLNAELQNKVDEFSRADDDMRNLLNSTDLATVFLDDGLNVRRFTTQATKLIRLIPGDVGRPVTDIASALLYPELADDTREVLRTLVFREREVAARDGRWFMARIMPYRTVENRISGAVMTFSDITAAKTLEAELRRAHGRIEERVAEQSAQTEKATELLRAEVAERGRTTEPGGESPRTGEGGEAKP